MNKNIIKQNYSFEKAIELVKNYKNFKFKESIDVAIQLNISPNKKNIITKGYSILPNNIGKNLKIAAFLTSENEITEAKNSNVDFILDEKIINNFNKKSINFDLLFTTTNAIIKMSKLNKILSTKNLNPDIKYGTITNNISDAIKKFKNNYIKYKTDKNDIIHTIIGKIDLNTKDLKSNLETLINDIKRQKNPNCKNMSIKKIHISSTMGKSIEININSLNI